ncbi:2,6-beta-D-fructofuranosidase [Roseibacterium elongatum DSM 19469]|uniref:beta-fructofuranosidase n=2 Tax=Roseicyclus elongatus TaxID=159346 RepID=W8S4Z7_9RHOB|nr:2,6-beta-D-fructofuranosidase [Roseibacterium elongatum DSM 19469]
MRTLVLSAGLLLGTLPAQADDLVIDFDGDTGLSERRVISPYHPVEFKPGVTGQAFDFDGYSTQVTGRTDPPALPFTVSAVIAPRSHSPNTAGLVHLVGDTTLRLDMNRWGYPMVRFHNPDDEPLQLVSDTPVRLFEWNTVAVTVDAETIRLTLNGETVAQQGHALGDGVSPGPEVVIGRNPDAPLMDGTFPTGHFNGLMDDIRIGASRQVAEPPAAAPDLSIARTRLDDDPNRPLFHPVPPAGWTNEPHAFFRSDGEWHLFYQANPNGPWWDLMQWGHLVSDDLLTWEPRPQALWPTPGADSQGVWVGDTFEGPNGVITALYTGVNGQWASVGLAQDEGEGLNKSPQNPVITSTPAGYQDMRDPFILRQEDGWLMLIGSGTADRQRPEILSFRSEDLIDWRFDGPLDIGEVERFGEYWELPKLFPIGDQWALFVTTVQPGAPARTQYWLGDWDGTRFTPQDPQPQLLDLFRTQLAHTFARYNESSHVAVGVVPEENRTGEERLEAGWIHGFGLPRIVSLCEGDDRLCQDPMPDIGTLFDAPAQSAATVGPEWQSVASDLDHGRVRLDLDLDNLSPIRIALRATADLEEATILTWYPEDQRLSLDFSRSSLTPHSRSDTLWATLPAETQMFDIFIDGSFVTLFTDTGGSAAFRVFPSREQANHVHLALTEPDSRTERDVDVTVWSISE